MPTKPTPAPQTDNLRGALWLLFSVVTASAMSLAVRELSGQIDSRMIVMLRGLVILGGMILLAPFFHAKVRGMRFSRPWLHAGRGALIGLSTHLGFYTLANIPLATATVLFFTAPIFATVMAIPINGERVGPRRWAAVGAGFAGAVIILRPGFDGFHPAMLAALGSSLLFGLALSMSRAVVIADGALSAYVSSVVATVIVSLPLALPVWSLPADTWGWIIALIMVATATARGVGDLLAYRWGEASLLAPITYLRLVFIGIAAWVIYGEAVDGPTWIGAAVIISATLYIARRERQIKSRAAAGTRTARGG